MEFDVQHAVEVVEAHGIAGPVRLALLRWWQYSFFETQNESDQISPNLKQAKESQFNFLKKNGIDENSAVIRAILAELAEISQKEETTIPPEKVARVRAIIDQITEEGFDFLLEQFLETVGEEFTEEDLVAEILEAGEYQTDESDGDEDTHFEDIVKIGVIAVGSDYGITLTE